MSDYLAPGTVLCDRWEIGRELGRGGYSVVYLARDRRLGSDVALKLLVPPPAAAELARERMRREVQVVRSLSHPCIVPVYEFMEDGPWSFIVMEYVAGPDLQVRVRQRGRLAADQGVRLGRDLASALAAAHRRGILHRDVKPQNVLLDPDGRFRLTDFGSARLDGQLGMTATGTLAGTPDYVAPEVAAGRRGDARADLYACGLTIYYGLAGELPDRSRPPAGDAYRAGSVVPGVPEWLDDVVARATAAAPEDRFPSAAALEEALAKQGAGAAEPAARCALCGGPDPFASGLCPGCGGGSDGAGKTLVVLQRPVGADAIAAARSRLVAVVPDAGDEALAATRGERPLFRTSADAARRIVEQLGAHQLAARTVPMSRAVELWPASFHLMLVAVVVAGAAAGVSAAPPLRWVTPIFVGLLLLSARRGAVTPLVSAARRRAALPPEVEQRLITALAELPTGTARDLLADLARLGCAVSVALRRAGADETAPALGELLLAGADAASDLALLDGSLGRFERQRERLAAQSDGWADALARCERARDALVQRLLDAMTVLGRLQGQAAELGGKALALDDTVAALRAEAEAQQAAAREIAALLGSPGP
ncbi:MAG TPA: serine/threonine-protein kinase [Gemmatimonadales bacterium]|nr:serine/threonine-protein kinase [Gemmatimonadales bacterium]